MGDSSHERLAQVCWKLASAAPEEVVADNFPETVVQKIQKLVRELRSTVPAAPETGVVDSTLEIPVQDPAEAAVVDNTLETPVQDSAEAGVRNSEPLLPKNTVAAEEEEGTRNPEPLQQKNAVPAAPPAPSPHQYTADSPVHPRQSGSRPAALLAEVVHLPAAGSR